MNIIIYFLINYQGFTVSPALVDKTVFGTEQITEAFELENFSDDSLRIKIEFEDFDISVLGDVNFLEAGSIPNSLAPLAIVNPEEFSIGPKQIEKIRVTFQIPQDAKTPEHYSMLLFKSQPIPTKYQPMISVAGEIGIPIYISDAAVANKNAGFEDLYVTHDTVFTTFRNIGNTHLRVKGEAKILLDDEKVIEKDSIREFVIFPGKIRKLKVPLTKIKKTVAKGDTCIIRIRLDYGAVELLEAERRFIR